MSQALFFSGGKDSFWCLRSIEGPVELITTIGEDSRRVPIQGIASDIVQAQANALGLPLQLIELPEPCDNRTYIRRIAECVTEAGYRRLLFGDLALEDIRDFRRRAFGDLGVELAFPIWGRDTSELALEMIESGLQARLCSINPAAMPERLLGRRFDRALLDELPDGADHCGENGEFHTLVLAGGAMNPIEVRPAGRTESMGHLVLDFELASSGG